MTTPREPIHSNGWSCAFESWIHTTHCHSSYRVTTRPPSPSPSPVQNSFVPTQFAKATALKRRQRRSAGRNSSPTADRVVSRNQPLAAWDLDFEPPFRATQGPTWRLPRRTNSRPEHPVLRQARSPERTRIVGVRRTHGPDREHSSIPILLGDDKRSHQAVSKCTAFHESSYQSSTGIPAPRSGADQRSTFANPRA
jgi:hypothetical protein